MSPSGRSPRRAAVPSLAGLLVGLLALAGCAGSGADEGRSAGRLSVVASTDVWGDVARTVGGPQVTVTSLIDGPSQDPHSFEASARTLLAVSRADVVVENGGGYDDFMARVLDTSGSGARVVNAVQVSGRRASAGRELNEHVWYDVRAVAAVADRISTQLGRADPSHATLFRDRAAALGDRLDGLARREAAIEAASGGRSIAITEPLPLYLTEACGLRDVTPAAFSRAVEEGKDVSPSVLEKTLDLVRSRKVAALVYNTQTTGPVTERVLAAARAAGVPVVPVTETLTGKDYLGWMRDNLDRLARAVAS